MDVADWLRSLGLGQYEALFRENEIDAEVLPELTEADLEKIAVPLGHRKRLLKAIANLGAAEARAKPTMPPPTASSRDVAERRPITVMFCDLVGSTSLAAKLDPEDWRNLVGSYLDAASAAVTSLGGHVLKKLGDGLMALFGYPAGAGERRRARRARCARDPARACRNQRQKRQQRRPKLSARIGLDSGQVVVDATGEVFGDAPNIAARVQGAAEPGSILITATVQRQTAGLFVAEDRGQHELKGLSAPMTLYRIVRASGGGRRGGARALTPLVGREEELGLLTRRWERARKSEGQFALIVGEPGLGKSRLIEEFRARLGETPHTWVEWSSSQLLQNTPLHPIVEWGRARFGGVEVAGEKRLAELEAALGSVGLDAAEYAPLLAPVIDAPLPPGRAPKVSAEELRSRQLAALAAWVLAGARTQPLVLAFEDLHWADPTTLDLMGALAERGAQAPLFIIATARLEFRSPWSLRPHHSVIALAPLDRAQVARMVGEISSGQALSDEVVEGVSERTGGVPLFIEEVTWLLLERGTEGGTRAIPPTLQQSLAARLDRLGPAREVARIGAVIGREFDYELLRAVARISENDLASALDLLCDSGLVFRRGHGPEGRFLFKHVLVQDAAYGSLLRADRRDVHRRIAEALEAYFSEITEIRPELLAHHFTEADVVEHAVRYWLKAGQQALRLSGMVEAAALLSKGLSLIATAPDSIQRREHELDLQIGLGQAIIATQGYGAPGVSQTYARAREICEQLQYAQKLMPILYGQWAHHSVADLVGARKLAAEIRHFSETQDSTVVRVMSCRASGLTHLMLGDFTAARADLEQGLSLYDAAEQSSYASIYATTDPFIFFQSYLSVALVCCGHLNWAHSRADSALAYARSLGHAHSFGFALHWTWVARRCAEWDLNELLAQADELMALSDQRSFVMWRALSLAFRGWCLAAMGDPCQGIPLITAGLAQVRDSGILHVPHVLMLLGDAHRTAGRPEIALAHVIEAEQFAEATHCKWLQAETLRSRGDLLLMIGDAAEAEASYLDAISLAERQCARLFQLRASASLAGLWRDQGRHKEASGADDGK